MVNLIAKKITYIHIYTMIVVNFCAHYKTHPEKMFSVFCLFVTAEEK